MSTEPLVLQKLIRHVKDWIHTFSTCDNQANEIRQLLFSHLSRFSSLGCKALMLEIQDLDRSQRPYLTLGKLNLVRDLQNQCEEKYYTLTTDPEERFQCLQKQVLNSRFENVLGFLQDRIDPYSWMLADEVLFSFSAPNDFKHIIYQWIQNHPYPERLIIHQRDMVIGNPSRLNQFFQDKQNVHNRWVAAQMRLIITRLKDRFVWIENSIPEPLHSPEILSRINHDVYVFYLDPDSRHFPMTLNRVHRLVCNWIGHCSCPKTRLEMISRYNQEWQDMDMQEICSFGILCRMINALAGFDPELTPSPCVSDMVSFKFSHWLQNMTTDRDDLLMDMISETKTLFTEFLRENLSSLGLDDQEMDILKHILEQKYQVYLR